MVRHWDVVSGDMDVWRKLGTCDFQGMFVLICVVTVNIWAFAARMCVCQCTL